MSSVTAQVCNSRCISNCNETKILHLCALYIHPMLTIVSTHGIFPMVLAVIASLLAINIIYMRQTNVELKSLIERSRSDLRISMDRNQDCNNFLKQQR